MHIYINESMETFLHAHMPKYAHAYFVHVCKSIYLYMHIHLHSEGEREREREREREL